MNNNENIDNIFRDKLAQKEILPPTKAWNKLDNAIKEDQKRVWYHYAAAAAILLIISFIGGNHFYNQSETSANTAISNSRAVEPLPYKRIETEPVEDLSAKITSTPDKLFKANLEPANTETSTIVTNNESDALKPRVVRVVKEIEKVNNDPIKKKTELVASNLQAEKPEDMNLASLKEEKTDVHESKKSPTVTIVYLRKKSTTQDSEPLMAKEENIPTASVIASANDHVEKDSKLKKLFKTAKDIKEGELSLTDVRNIKEDILNMKIKL